MATYHGMKLGGEVRESISLDEDDMSDVEDEVFIRDGKNGYKLAEDINVKRPLMAPRRKVGKPDITTRLKNKPPCRVFCKPCCYVFAALSVLIGLIILVVITVSIFPLPLDKLRDWIISKSEQPESTTNLIACDNLKITDIWSVNLPKLTTDSPIRTLDINKDGAEDLIFGFGTGDNYDILPPDIFCPIFMGVPPACEGGVIALDGLNGDIIWRTWMNDTIFSVHCNCDINADGLNDCLAIGMEGTMAVLNSRNGSSIWTRNTGKGNVYIANFIPDQNNDNVSDILASHSSLHEKFGHLILFSGKTGKELKRLNIPYGAKTFYMPQLLNSDNIMILFGTGSPNTPGNLSMVPLVDIVSGKSLNKSITIFEDVYKGILTQSVLVDITGDKIPDIITAMYNSTVVAINGKNYSQIWNFSIPGIYSETNVSPTPGYFNSDNISDFLVIYQKYDNILNYNYTQTFIIDGKTGKSMYKPISGSIISQMNGLSLSMESIGYDMFLFWTVECMNIEIFKKIDVPTGNFNPLFDECRQQYNTTSIMKLFALNQFHQPPGIMIYNSANRTSTEFNNTKSLVKQVKEYFKTRTKIRIDSGQTEADESYIAEPVSVRRHKYGLSNFRQKDGHTGIIRDYVNKESSMVDEHTSDRYNQYYDWAQNPTNLVNNLPDEEYNLEDSDSNLFNSRAMSYDDNVAKAASRGTRSKGKAEKVSLTTSKPELTEKTSKPKQKPTNSKKKNLSDPKYSIYDYKNIRMARSRLLNDVNNLPTDILRDTLFKNEEQRLRRSRFEQRDINSHTDKMKENEEVKKILEQQKNVVKNESFNLWDLETEKEIEERDKGYWRGKRQVDYYFDGIRKITSVGSIINSMNNTKNSVDIVFITYWQPTNTMGRYMSEAEIQECIEDKMKKPSDDDANDYQKRTESERKAMYGRECNAEREDLKHEFGYFNKMYQLRLGQMTVYRIRVECLCQTVNKNDRCARFLPTEKQRWPAYLGRLGDGYFRIRN